MVRICKQPEAYPLHGESLCRGSACATTQDEEGGKTHWPCPLLGFYITPLRALWFECLLAQEELRSCACLDSLQMRSLCLALDAVASPGESHIESLLHTAQNAGVGMSLGRLLHSSCFVEVQLDGLHARIYASSVTQVVVRLELMVFVSGSYTLGKLGR